MLFCHCGVTKMLFALHLLKNATQFPNFFEGMFFKLATLRSTPSFDLRHLKTCFSEHFKHSNLRSVQVSMAHLVIFQC